MKFTFFHLMAWPHLAEDFRQQHHSVWVDLPNSLYDPVAGHDVYHNYLDQLEYAEKCGFDGLGVNEHHANAYGLMPSPNLMAATLTRRTSRAAIVVLGNSIALYSPAVRVAEEMAMLDVMSGGRFVGGFPVGTSMDTNYAYGTVPTETRERYAEAHELIVKAWTEREPFAFNGRYNKLRYVNIWPRPVQQPHPPIHVPGGGSVETYDFCIENTYSYSYLSYSGYLRGRDLMRGYWDEVGRHAVDESPYRAGFAQVIAVGETDAEAEKLYRRHIDYFYNRCLHVYAGFGEAPGYRTVKTLKKGAIPQFTPKGAKTLSQLTWKELLDQRYVICGSPETVRQQCEEMIKDLRFGNLFCLMALGSMPHEVVMHSTRLFGEKVIPKLKNLWPDYADDNRFWCKPIADRRQPDRELKGAA